MKLHLIRHAKTEIGTSRISDFDRKLLPKGVVQANCLGTFLSLHVKIAPKVFCSDAMRTSQTAEIINHQFSLGKINFDHLLYLSDRQEYLKLIWDEKSQQELMIIGHNDGISSVASYFTDEMVHMKTCAYLCISFEAEKWSEVSRGTGRITAEFRPSVYLPDVW